MLLALVVGWLLAVAVAGMLLALVVGWLLAVTVAWVDMLLT